MLFILKTENGTFEITSFIKNIKRDGISTLQFISPYVKSDDLIIEGDADSINMAYNHAESIKIGAVITKEDFVSGVQMELEKQATVGNLINQLRMVDAYYNKNLHNQNKVQSHRDFADDDSLNEIIRHLNGRVVTSEEYLNNIAKVLRNRNLG